VRGTAYGTLRDWEWMDIAMMVDVDDHDRAALAEMISADAAFLGEQGLLDYSLLVGIHRLPPELTPEQREARLHTLRLQGGYPSVDRRKVYFFGIIDVHERFSLRWKVQRALLSVGYHLLLRAPDAAGMSALPPVEYADRFRTFAMYEVLQLPLPPSLTAESGALQQGASAGALDPRDTGTMQSALRWGPLWERRRRGLVKERIEGEREDHIRRIQELEDELRRLRPPASRQNGQRPTCSGALTSPLPLVRDVTASQPFTTPPPLPLTTSPTNNQPLASPPPPVARPVAAAADPVTIDPVTNGANS